MADGGDPYHKVKASGRYKWVNLLHAKYFFEEM